VSYARILVTGGAGFIGSHLVHRLLREHPGTEVVNLDLLTYAGRPENLADLEGEPRHRFVHGDMVEEATVAEAAAGCDAIVNVAAETHVDRSIFGGDEFIRTNVLGTKRLLDWARRHPGTRFVQVSTDEVYGDVEAPHRSRETDPLAGSSPCVWWAARTSRSAPALLAAYGLLGASGVASEKGGSSGPSVP